MENNQTEAQMKEINPPLNAATGGFAFSAAVTAFLVFSVLYGLILKWADIEVYSAAYWYLNFLVSPLAICTAVMFIVKSRKLGFKNVVPVRTKPKYFIIAVLLVFGMYCSLNKLNGLFIGLIGKEESEHMLELAKFLNGLNAGTVFAALLVIAVLPAIGEEILFRGVILNSVESSAGSVAAVFAVGLCFSLFHTSPEQTVYQFIAGCLFAFIAVRSRSVVPGILMHFLNNAATIVLAACGLCDEFGALIIAPSLDIALTVLGAFALAGGVLWLILDKKPLVKFNKNGLKTFCLYASAGIVVCVIIWICALVGVGG